MEIQDIVRTLNTKNCPFLLWIAPFKIFLVGDFSMAKTYALSTNDNFYAGKYNIFFAYGKVCQKFEYHFNVAWIFMTGHFLGT